MQKEDCGFDFSPSWRKFIFHFLPWLILLISPILWIDWTHTHIPWQKFLFKHTLNLGFNVVVFYLNFYVWVPQLLIKRKHRAFLGRNLAFLLPMLFFLYFVYSQIISGYMLVNEGHLHKPPIFLLLFGDSLAFSLSVGVASAIRVTQRLQSEKDRYQEMENEHLKSELLYLKYQLQPHFFFNTLNNIYALIDLAPKMAQENVLRLSRLMRYVLYHSDEMVVPLADEIQFLQNYVELMRLRYAEHVQIEMEFPKEEGLQVPPLLLIPLLENAFKHGVDARQPSFIQLSLRLDEEWLCFEVKNSLFPKTETDKSGSGIGLENLCKRLELFYPEKNYQFEQGAQSNYFLARLCLPK
ncbi:sensor histidine kinase [Saprospira grandis]|uniref:sensor histidine kinase n=1 Tax=Saprospira grandis TaxID=1008 RepID=UPI0022DE4EF0|nr:sensor histidine kinase [Saprospira grandis]WBM74735.1 sensor histidine kinase [Saprospira grandis]